MELVTKAIDACASRQGEEVSLQRQVQDRCGKALDHKSWFEPSDWNLLYAAFGFGFFVGWVLCYAYIFCSEVCGVWRYITSRPALY